jgi:hypothetical protein
MRSIPLLLALTSVPALAQADPRADLAYPLHQRVRVALSGRDAQRFVGRVARVDSNHLELLVTGAGTVLAVPLASVATIEADGGIDRGKGLRRGALVGLGLGTYFFATTYPEIREDDQFGIGFIATGLVSFGIAPATGAVIGYAMAPRRWSALVVPAPTSTAPTGSTIRFATDEHVRLRTSDATLSGRVHSQTQTVVTLTTSAATVPVSWADVRRIEVRGGKDRVKGAATGALLFIGLGILGEQTAPTTSTSERIGAFTGAALVGGYLGSRFLAPRGWSELPAVGP